MFLMFCHMFNLTLKLFLGSNTTLNVCFITQIYIYRKWSEQMNKEASNTVDVSSINDVTCQQIILCMGDTSMALDTYLSICSLS